MNGAMVAAVERLRAKARERVENCMAPITFAVRVPILTRPAQKPQFRRSALNSSRISDFNG